ncbi:MAG: ribosomal protein S18-alanine N-acetyltransferase [Rhodospirillaceae bacterium]|nr:ribosomal protein S18-alanine N-acetyltransferase [Rhodospirillaceae bacterium]
MKIIPITHKNVEQLAEILAELHARAFTIATPEGNESWGLESILSSLSQKGVFALLATSNEDVPLGFVLGRAVGPNEKYDGEGEILTIAVDPASQGRGYGQRLLQDAIVSARKAGAKKMYLEVASDNDVAIALYNKFGFKKIARRKDYYVRKTEVMDALIMEKSI